MSRRGGTESVAEEAAGLAREHRLVRESRCADMG